MLKVAKHFRKHSVCELAKLTNLSFFLTKTTYKRAGKKNNFSLNLFCCGTQCAFSLSEPSHIVTIVKILKSKETPLQISNDLFFRYNNRFSRAIGPIFLIYTYMYMSRQVCNTYRNIQTGMIGGLVTHTVMLYVTSNFT